MHLLTTSSSYEQALDGYLHALVRSRPWIKKREEAALLALGEWLYQHGLSALSDVTLATVERYARAQALSDAAWAELITALHHLFTWAIYDGVTQTNPFAAHPLVAHQP
ncbi:hypothetical protein [Kallotenue papyrolyticum]|uniref:hypothetical protein n=1 Tax=Kallotenue papyrolyticum TaxID=1325125 RepID=UPI0004785344|nr:hypothetical protein [Kallotenue papyrolyticum]